MPRCTACAVHVWDTGNMRAGRTPQCSSEGEESWAELGQVLLQAFRPGPSPPAGPKGSWGGAVLSVKGVSSHHLPWGHPRMSETESLGPPAGAGNTL